MTTHRLILPQLVIDPIACYVIWIFV